MKQTCNAYATDSPTRPGAIVSLEITANKEAKNRIAAPINSRRRANHLKQKRINSESKKKERAKELH